MLIMDLTRRIVINTNEQDWQPSRMHRTGFALIW
jgi:hypothetical protein